MYYTHFVFPVIALAIVWAASRVQWVRFMRRFATLLGVACIMFVLMPTVPPWMASSQKYHYRLFPQLARRTGRGFQDLGFKGFVNDWQNALDWGNAVAAMPSLHAAFALFVPAFFLPMIKPKWLKAVVLVFPVMMLASLVYFGEHWIIDGLVGWALVGGSFWFWNWWERRQRTTRATRARQALGTTA
jgi:membrane-associated phospholipid phosphatase